jgi:L-aspartate oxidase
MTMATPRRRQADVVVIGTGVAGLATAWAARGRRVLLITKSGFAEGGSSPYAQGGIAAALGADDSADLHTADTLMAGAGLCRDEVVRSIIVEGPRRVRELMEIGARFDRREDGALSLGREGAHSRHRVAHAAGDATGAELVRALADAVRRAAWVERLEHTLVVRLLQDGRRVVGVEAVSQSGDRVVIGAGAVVLASGGIGQLYTHTTNPVEVTGDGLALAARAGARLSGLEFVQFHPTAMGTGGSPAPLLTEALRGEGATLVDETGHRIMPAIHELAELAPRDIVARAIFRHRRDRGPVFLDATHLGEAFHTRFPTVSRLCAERHIDPARQPVPVAPAAHYHMGGVMTDLEGRSSIPGLWACGEVSFTGLHGANRLASNSLLEALVMGSRCGEILAVAPVPAPTALEWRTGDGPVWLEEDAEGRVVADAVRALMWDGAGVERTAWGISRARGELERLATEVPRAQGEAASMMVVSDLVLRAAEARTESRGGHYRADIPVPCDCWVQDLVFEGRRLLPPRPVRPFRRAVG